MTPQLIVELVVIGTLLVLAVFGAHRFLSKAATDIKPVNVVLVDDIPKYQGPWLILGKSAHYQWHRVTGPDRDETRTLCGITKHWGERVDDSDFEGIQWRYGTYDIRECHECWRRLLQIKANEKSAADGGAKGR